MSRSHSNDNGVEKNGGGPSSIYIGAARYEQIRQLASGANRSPSNYMQHALWFYEAAKRHLPPEQFLRLDQGLSQESGGQSLESEEPRQSAIANGK